VSKLAPDLPELEGVPYARRSIVYVTALNRAVRSPLTWLMGALAIAVGAGIGANQGSALFGRPGVFLGTVMGVSAGIWSFFKLLVPWRARRMLPSVIEESAGGGNPV
jgi:hypothetical protein